MTTPLVSKGFDRDTGTARARRQHGDPFGWSALALDVVTLSARYRLSDRDIAHLVTHRRGAERADRVDGDLLRAGRWSCSGCAGCTAAPMRLELTEALREIVSATAIAAVLTMAARVLTTNEAYVAAETVRHWVVAVPLLMAGRGVVLLAEARRRRVGARRAADARRGRRRGRQAHREPPARRPRARPRARRVPRRRSARRRRRDRRRCPSTDWDDFERGASKSRAIEHVIIAFSGAEHPRLHRAGPRAPGSSGVAVSVVPRLFELEGERAEIEHLGGLPLVALRPADRQSWQFRLKYALDRVVAAGLLVPRAARAPGGHGRRSGDASAGPILFRQPRVGRDGVIFEMLKLRTLREAPRRVRGGRRVGSRRARRRDASRPTLRWSCGSSRVTHFLRRSAIDELPQLWNVVRGEMSLVGPRPERLPVRGAVRRPASTATAIATA